MRKIVFIFFFLINFIVFSQEKEKKYSFNFNQSSIKNAIELIEKNSDYRFYFEKEWIESNPILITETVNEITIEEVLKMLFQPTELNFFIDKKHIILSKNNAIRDELPENYFGKAERTTDQKTSVKPVFYMENDSVSNKPSKTESLIVIGKEAKKSDKKRVI